MNNKRFPLQVIGLGLSIALVAGCASTKPTPMPVSDPMPESASYWPTEGWRVSTPEQQGMDSELLAQMLQAIEDRELNLHGALVIRNGYIVTEAYFPSYQQDTKHELWSVTKSIVSALVGITIDKGYIDGVNRPVLDYFPNLETVNGDPRKRALTLEHLLTMTSGLDWSDDEDISAMVPSRDWARLDVVVVFTSWLPESEFVQLELLARAFVVPAVISPPLP